MTMQKVAENSSYRWIVVFASALILALAMGSIVNGLSAFVIPMQQAYGWMRADISLINAAGIMGIAIGGVIMGILADRFGSRALVLMGSLVMGICYLLASQATSLWQFQALMFLAGFLGAAAIFAPIMAAVGNWFPIGAGLAIGIASAGQALGQGGVPVVSSMLIRQYGIDGALAITGAAMLIFLVPLSLLLRPAPGAIAAMSDAHDPGLADYPPFPLVVAFLSTAIVLCCTCMSVPLMHLVPLVQDRGFAPVDAGRVIFAMLVIAVAGRIAFGKLADIIGALPAYMTATLWMTLMVYGFIFMNTLDGFFIYAIIYGFGYAGVMTGVLVSVASLTHPSRRASALGIVGFFGWLGHANGGFLGGFVFDQTGQYDLAYAIAAATGIANLVVVSILYMKVRGPGQRAATA